MVEFDQIAYNTYSDVKDRPVSVAIQKSKTRDSGKSRVYQIGEVMGFRVWCCEAPCSSVKLKKTKSNALKA